MLPRLKFEIAPLVTEILDKLPTAVFTSTTTTFFDPALAGGQFAVELIRKLREYGHSDDNIAARVFGLAEDVIDLNYAVRTKKLIGKYTVGSITELEQMVKQGKKFDVVVGNPPYQSSDGVSTNNSTLWDKIATLTFELIAPNGKICLVTPQSWMRPNHPMLSWFKANALSCVSTEISHHFPTVGSTFCYWIASPGSVTQNIADIDGVAVDITAVPYLVPSSLLSVHNKVMFSNQSGVFDLLSDQTTAHTEKMSKGSKRFSGTLTKEKTATNCYEIFHTNAQTLYSSIKTKNFDDKKVMFSDSGYFKPAFDAGIRGSSQRCHYFLVSSDQVGENLASVLNLKVYQFIVNTAKWSGFSDLRVLRNLPKVDLTRSWTDAELYAHFNLTQEEIDLIESTIK